MLVDSGFLALHSNSKAQDFGFHMQNFPDSGIGILSPGAKPLIFLGYNPPYGKRWRLNILPQFLSNVTRAITHKVIIFFFFLGGGGRGQIRPCYIATLPILGLKFIKLSLCVFMSNFMVFMR